MRLNAFLILVRAVSMETSLYYYRARYYDSAGGRFLAEDPIRFLGGINLYAYVRDNSVRYRDPSGRDPIIGVAVGVVAGAINGGIGAAMAGGNANDIIIAATIGGTIGAGIGAIDPSLGIGTLAIIGGASAGLGDLFGQVIAGAGTKCKPINWGSALGATAGGALSGALGVVGLSLGTGELSGTILGAVLGMGPATLGPAAGALNGKPTVPSGCGCQ